MARSEVSQSIARNLSMMFSYPQTILFRHCDPAGIVFYPRYFEMINDCVETFFAQVLDWPFEVMHPEAGVPTVTISVDFTAPSRHGDRLELKLRPVALGRCSFDFEIIADCQGQTRFKARSTLVHVDASGRPQSWPPEIRNQLSSHLESAQ